MKFFWAFLCFVNILVVFINVSGLLIFLIDHENYRFGTEVAGWAYYSATHHVVILLFLVLVSTSALITIKKLERLTWPVALTFVSILISYLT